MSDWVGREFYTDDLEHGRVLDRSVLHTLPRRQLVALIEAKTFLELVEWDNGHRLELISEEYLADEGTHVSVSASPEAAKLSRQPQPLSPALAVLVVLALCAGSLMLARVHTRFPGSPRAPVTAVRHHHGIRRRSEPDIDIVVDHDTDDAVKITRDAGAGHGAQTAITATSAVQVCPGDPECAPGRPVRGPRHRQHRAGLGAARGPGRPAQGRGG